MTPHNRVLVVVGGAAVIASLTIVVIFVLADLVGGGLQTDAQAAFKLRTLGDELLTDVHEQREAIDEYLMSADPRPLARYRQAVSDEMETASQIRGVAGSLSGVTDALARVDSENDVWRANIADPAIAAVQSGSASAVRAAIRTEVLDEEATQVSPTSQFILQIDAIGEDLGVRSDALNGLRVAVTVLGVAIELLAAGLSLWFVRRYGLRVERDTRRRASVNAERIEIIASLRTLRMQQTPEATAADIAEALKRLPGVDIAGVLECTADGLLGLAILGLPGFPIQTGEAVPTERSRYLRERSDGGPWAEHWALPAEPTAYEEGLEVFGIKSQAYAPIRADGELIGLIVLATTDEGHGLHLVEDLPAVGEFASVAETILAPALVARRDRADERRRIAATIASTAFRPVFQPIVDLATGTTVGFEALTRFDDGSRPDCMFAAALACGMGIELEIATLEAAIREVPHVPQGVWLSFNVSPALVVQEGTLGRLLTNRAGPIVLEVTEHETIEAYAPMREAILQLGPGVRLAVDDAGAGVANFNHIVELRPDFVKVDAGLVHGVDADLRRQAVVAGILHFASAAGCTVIAEGIESEAELATLIQLGVSLGQGFLLGRPAPAATWLGQRDDRSLVSPRARRRRGPAPGAGPSLVHSRGPVVRNAG